MNVPSSQAPQSPDDSVLPIDDPDRTMAGDPSAPNLSDREATPTFPQATDDSPAAAAAWPEVPGYHILDVLGRGGMGVVYKARQIGLGRYVALKMILGGAHASPEDMVRFLAEGEAVAQLQHTNIVQIYQVGRHGELPFFSLEYVDGGSLAQFLDGTPRQPRDAAGLVECLARAMYLAHQKGIVHRDLKPSNILLASGGRKPPDSCVSSGGLRPPLADYIPKISDFGLAKRVEAGCGLTQTGAILGTPSYMAPEQAEAKKDVGPPADIYALGAILYEILTGRPPFQGPTPLDTILQVLGNEPVSPRRLQPGCPRDLETICLKCLHKEPAKRYATAEALADDLQRYLTDRPILARRTGKVERLRRWCRRNPLIAGMTATVALLLLLLAIGSSVAAVWLHRTRAQALESLGKAEAAEQRRTEQLATSYLEQARARRYSRKLGQRFQSLDALTEAVRIVRAMDLTDEQRNERLQELRNEAIACMALMDLRSERRLADFALETHGTGFQKSVAFTSKWNFYARAEIGGPISVRRVDADSEIIRLPGANSVAYILAFSPDGRYLAAKYFQFDKPIEFIVWDWRNGRKVVRQACAAPISPTVDFAFTPDSRHVFLGCRPDAALGRYDLANGKQVNVLGAGAAMPWTIAVHQDGRRLATVWGKNVTIFDTETGKPLGVPWRLPDDPWSLAWQGASNVLAVGSGNRVFLWDSATRQQRGVLDGHEGTIHKIVFNPAGTLLASSSWDATARLWDPASGKELLRLAGEMLEFSGDGRRLAYQQGQELGFWEVADGGICRPLVHGLDVNAVHFSPDGRLLAVAAQDDASLWDARTCEQLAELKMGRASAALFHPDGKSLLVSSWQGLNRLPLHAEWHGSSRLRVGRPVALPLPFGGNPRARADARGDKLAVILDMSMALILDGKSGAELRRLTQHPRMNLVDISPDGRWAVTSTFKGADVRVWDLERNDTRTPAQSFRAGDRAGASFSRDGRWLVVDELSQATRFFYRVGSWELARQERFAPGEGSVMAFNKDGGMMAVTSQGGRQVRLLDGNTGRTFAELPSVPSRRLGALCFSDDGRQLAAVGGRFVQLWDLAALRSRLRDMALDWDASPYPPAADRPTAERRLEVSVDADDRGVMNRIASSVVVQPPTRRRVANAEEIAAWLKQLGDADAKRRQAAADALAEVGAPAFKALSAIAEGGQGERRKQARAILDRILVAEALAPTRVRLQFKDVPIADAIRTLAEKSGLPLTYRPQPNAPAPKSISLELRDVSVWEALDRICEAGQLGYFTGYDRYVQISPQISRPSGAYADAGPLRLRVSGGNYQRYVFLSANQPMANESSFLNLQLLREPRMPLLAVGSPRLTVARDADGHSYLLPQSVQRNFMQSINASMLAVPVSLPLKPSEKSGGKLQLLQGVLPLEIATHVRELVAVPDITKAAARTFRGPQGHRVTVQSVQGGGNSWFLNLRLSGPRGWIYEPNTHRLELIDANGRRAHPPAYLQAIPLREPLPSDLAWLGLVPQPPSLASWPWPALALHASPGGRTEWTGMVQHFSGEPLKAPIRLRLMRFERLKTEVPFELCDVPLP